MIGLVASRGRPSRHRWIPNSSHARRCPVPYSVVAALFGASRGVRGLHIDFVAVVGGASMTFAARGRPGRCGVGVMIVTALKERLTVPLVAR